MSKDRELIFDMTGDPEVLTYPAVDNEPLQLGGVVVNAPTPGRILNRIRSSVDVPVVVTVANSDTNYRHRIEDGAAILNVAAGAQTPEIVAEIRERFPDYPIIATGGADDESIRVAIRAGANAIIWTPPTNGELFRDVMKNYRAGKPHP